MTEQPTARECATTDDADDGPVDLTLLLAVHWGLRRDLRQFTGAVLSTPVEERETWRALSERWAVFSSFAHGHRRWERSDLWPLVVDGARQAGNDEAATVVDKLVAAAVVAEKLIESCAPIFERLAAARDEDAAATLRARVRAASSSLEDSLDDEDAEGLPLVLRYVPTVRWRAAVEGYLLGASRHEVAWESLPWLVHELPVQTAAMVAAEWAPGPASGLLDGTAAFRRLEASAFRHSNDVQP